MHVRRALWIALVAVLLAALAALVTIRDDDEDRPAAGTSDPSVEPSKVATDRRGRRHRDRTAETPALTAEADAATPTAPPALVSPPTPPTPPAAETAEIAETAQWRVTVLGRLDAPAAGLRLRAKVGDKLVDVFTDERGVAALPCAPNATELEVQVPGFRGVGAEGGRALARALAERDGILRLVEIPSLDVIAVDAQTGTSLSAAVRIRAGGAAELRVETPAHLAAAPFTTDPGGFQVEADPPAGYALLYPRMVVNVPVSRFAAQLRLVIPLRREVPWRVRVVDADDRPVAGAAVVLAMLGGMTLRPRATSGAGDAEIAVHGIPFLRGETLAVLVALEEGDYVWGAMSDRVQLCEPNSPLVTVVRLPRDPVRRAGEGGIGGAAGGAFGGRRGGHRNLRGGGHRPTASVVVHVMRRNGAPAAGARVRLVPGADAYTDAAGDARFDGLNGGSYVVHVAEAGFVPAAASVTVGPAGTARVDIVEPTGRSLEVRVVDEQGDPLPFATVEALVLAGYGDWVGHIEVSDDLQDLVARESYRLPYDATALYVTDAQGLLTLRRLPPGQVRLRAWFGSRSAAATALAPGSATLQLGSSN